jgi:hypothetical protein
MTQNPKQSSTDNSVPTFEESTTFFQSPEQQIANTAVENFNNNTANQTGSTPSFNNELISDQAEAQLNALYNQNPNITVPNTDLTANPNQQFPNEFTPYSSVTYPEENYQNYVNYNTAGAAFSDFVPAAVTNVVSNPVNPDAGIPVPQDQSQIMMPYVEGGEVAVVDESVSQPITSIPSSPILEPQYDQFGNLIDPNIALNIAPAILPTNVPTTQLQDASPQSTYYFEEESRASFFSKRFMIIAICFVVVLLLLLSLLSLLLSNDNYKKWFGGGISNGNNTSVSQSPTNSQSSDSSSSATSSSTSSVRNINITFNDPNGPRPAEIAKKKNLDKLENEFLVANFADKTKDGKCQDDAVCGVSADEDKDGFTNLEEQNYLTNPKEADTDKDGIADGDEANIYSTDPTKKDSTNAQVDDLIKLKVCNDPAFRLTNISPKLTEARQKEIIEKTAKAKLHEPTIDSLKKAGATNDDIIKGFIAVSCQTVNIKL